MRKENGFTLIEVVIVVAIISVLAAIAIPKFAEMRGRAFDDAAISDLRNAATCQEAYFTDYETYTKDRTVLIDHYDLHESEGVVLEIDQTNTDSSGYVMTASHPSGNNTYKVEGPGGTIDKL